MGTKPKQRYIKRIPLTIGLFLVSLIGFIASPEFRANIDEYLFNHISGNGSNGNALGLVFGGCLLFLILGLIIVLAIALIWRGIAEWPLPPN
jgi:hypothetical protein